LFVYLDFLFVNRVDINRMFKDTTDWLLIDSFLECDVFVHGPGGEFRFGSEFEELELFLDINRVMMLWIRNG